MSNELKKIEDVYPGRFASYYDAPYDYDPMVLSLCDEIALSVADDDYQGDTRYLLKRGGEWGWVIVGWGSCSGCDALQGAESYAEVDRLRSDIATGIEWHPSLDALKERVRSKDWKVEWSYHADETKEWIKKVLDYEKAR